MGFARRLGLLGAAAFALVGALPAPALAGLELECGDTITTDTTLTADMDCSGVYYMSGLSIGADGITLNLGGHTINGYVGDDYPTVYGIDTQGHKNVTIRHGTLRNYDTGIYVNASVRSTIKGLRIFGEDDYAQTGVYVLTGVANTITELIIDSYPTGIKLEQSAKNKVTWNTITSSANYSIYAYASTRDSVAHNTSNGIPGQTYGLWDSYSYAQRYRYNTFKNGSEGAYLSCQFSTYVTFVGNQAIDNSSHGFDFYGCYDQQDRGSTIRDNIATGNGQDGFFAYYMQSSVWTGNVAKRNQGSGFTFWYPNLATITGNTANHNGGDGIRIQYNDIGYNAVDFSRNEANSNGNNGHEADFFVPGSANRAKLNTNTNCINVVCS